MSFYLSGIGTAVPNELITQDDAARLAVELTGGYSEHSAAMKTLYRKAGVHKRHSTLVTASTNGQPATQSFFPIARPLKDRGPTTGERMRQYESWAIELASRASADAIENSGVTPSEISHLVTVSCTGF